MRKAGTMERVLKLSLFCLVLCFAAARFVHLDADFPVELNWSGDIYAADGQNAASAIRHVGYRGR